MLEHIDRGDVYQANLTHRLSGRCSSAVELYAELRRTAPVPYNLYLDGGSFELAGASPETFLRADPDGSIESRPIKGTAPRSEDAAADSALAAALAVSPKDRAENTMIVDLTRNDLSRVCTPGSVRVSELCAVESHPTVHQMVSTVEGRLRPGLDALDAVAAAFPPGSMTGCPKVRAMQVIEQLEPVRRGPYAGAFGWLAPDGACDLAVVIRTAVVTDGRAHLHVGGAIVADSEARAEYDESLLKARTVARALGARLPDRVMARRRMAPGRYQYGPAVYGSVLATSLVGSMFEEQASARIMTLTLVSSILIFWIAHAWSEVVGERLANGPVFDRSAIWPIAISEWPLVESGMLPAALLALAWAGLYSRQTGAVLALGASLLQLVGWGVLAGYRTRERWWNAWLVGAFDGVLGLAIVGIEIALHH